MRAGEAVSFDVVIPLAHDPRSEWQDLALCAETDPDSFFPEHGGGTSNVAKRVCMSCEVRSECLEYALLNDIRFGVWGALNVNERERLQGRAV